MVMTTRSRGLAAAEAPVNSDTVAARSVPPRPAAEAGEEEAFVEELRSALPQVRECSESEATGFEASDVPWPAHSPAAHSDAARAASPSPPPMQRDFQLPWDFQPPSGSRPPPSGTGSIRAGNKPGAAPGKRTASKRSKASSQTQLDLLQARHDLAASRVELLEARLEQEQSLDSSSLSECDDISTVKTCTDRTSQWVQSAGREDAPPTDMTPSYDRSDVVDRIDRGIDRLSRARRIEISSASITPRCTESAVGIDNRTEPIRSLDARVMPQPVPPMYSSRAPVDSGPQVTSNFAQNPVSNTLFDRNYFRFALPPARPRAEGTAWDWKSWTPSWALPTRTLPLPPAHRRAEDPPTNRDLTSGAPLPWAPPTRTPTSPTAHRRSEETPQNGNLQSGAPPPRALPTRVHPSPPTYHEAEAPPPNRNLPSPPAYRRIEEHILTRDLLSGAPPPRAPPTRALELKTPFSNPLPPETRPQWTPPKKVPQGDSPRSDIQDLAAAITQAVRAGNSPSPRYLSELPTFTGAANEWLAFKGAFQDTASYFSSVENTARLRKALRGTAYEAVSCLFLGNSSPLDIVNKLENRFGRPEALVLEEIAKVKALPRLTDSPRDICIFASKIENVVATIQVLHREEHLYNPEMIKILEDKLTQILRSRWYDYEYYSNSSVPTLVKFSNFMESESDKAARHAPPESVKPHTTENRGNPFRKTCASVHDEPTQRKEDGQCPICKKTKHNNISQCTEFARASVNDRWELAKEHKLCFRCLKYRGLRHVCKKTACEAPGCTYFHHRLLHHDKPPQPQPERTAAQTAEIIQTSEQPVEQQDEKPAFQAVITSAQTNAQTTRKAETYVKVIPITVSGPAGEVDTYALLDDGSTVTLITEEIANQINVKGRNEPFYIEAVGGTRIDASNSQVVSMKIRGRFQQEKDNVEIIARTIGELNISPQAVMENALAGCYHLKEIAGELSYEHGTPTVLVGQDNWALLLASEIRTGHPNQPIASLTPLGWVLHGSRTPTCQSCATTFKERVSFTKVQARDDSLEKMVKDSFDLEALGVMPQKPRSDPEERALRILQDTTRPLDGGGYETGLLWKSDKTDITSPQRTWYLPHFPVLNPAKPGKCRIVHDAAAQTKGVCLNDFLLTGPDLLESLIGVLMRFRQQPVAVVADIRDMFMRIQVRGEDRDALRFLWRESPDKPVKQYRMKAVIFGATSSPCTAIYVKNHNADRHADEYPEAVRPVKYNHYMDDYLQSFASAAEANRIARAVDTVHRYGRFELQKWTSNEPAALTGLDAPAQKPEVSLGENSEKILGMIWRPGTDQLGYNLNFARVDAALLDGTKTPTKREMLRAAMSLYDPLGLIAPVTIQAKHILQETWTQNIGWDDKLTPDLENAWQGWLASLQNVAKLRIPRCYGNYGTATKLQLHTFVDASQNAYAAASYWRATNEDGRVEVSLAAAKARVGSLKVTSIPRMELQAATLGARLARTVANEHDRPPELRVFWTDSRTVLAWLQAGARVFKPFVAHRVAEIEQSTQQEEWRWVPTLDNVADDATRKTPPNFDGEHRWFVGPAFLYQGEDTWPTQPTVAADPDDPERTHTVSVKTDPIPVTTAALPDPERFSSWLRLIRTTARVLQFIGRIRQRCQARTAAARKGTRANKDQDPTWTRTRSPRRKEAPTPPSQPARPQLPLEVNLIIKAEELHVKALQEQSFGEEIQIVTGGNQPSKQSRLRNLAIVIDNAGTLRVKSRVDAAAALMPTQRSPAILDGDHPYCRLYIHWVHCQLHHGGVETVTNEVRQRYWVLRLRPTVRTVLKQCQLCRLRRATAPQPPTGGLPHGRVAHHHRPFTYSGLDYFGPLSVTVGRQHQKRYGALFTCLTTRAVHLEIAGSLSTGSAIMALRRFIARRGCPTEIWSDNGTNLRGADLELRRAALEAAEGEAAVRCIQWRFIPPSAPFMGGAWERLVRSVKTALYVTLHERHPTEEVMLTLLVEAEHTVNSRPLTHVSVEAEDETALTPNHFILGGPSRVPIPGSFTDSDLIGRAHWRAAQRLADIFWHRWVREALPLLQMRREPSGSGDNLCVGDLVIIADGNLPRNVWPRGRVIATYPGPDNVVRIVDVQTNNGVLRRPAKKLLLLPA